MDFLTFFASLVSALAWPIVTVVAVFALRRPLFSLLQNIDRLKYGDLDISLSGELADLEERLNVVRSFRSVSPPGLSSEVPEVLETVNRLAPISPQSAIVEAWARLEEAIRVWPGQDKTVDRPGSPGDESRATEIAALIDELQRLRNRVVYDRKVVVTAEQALYYGYLAESLIELLRE